VPLRYRLILPIAAVLAAPAIVAIAVPDAGRNLVWELIGVSVVACFAGWALYRYLAAAVVRPLGSLGLAMSRLASGESVEPLPPGPDDEVGALVGAFNKASERFAHAQGEVERNREELRMSVRRLGETLRATHDLTKLLSVVLETAALSMKASAGAVYLLSTNQRELYVKVARNLDRSLAGRRIRIGEGVAGSVIETREPVLVMPGGTLPPPSEAEPVADSMIAVPLETGTQLMGVLALYGREAPDPFVEADLDTMTTLARAAAVGIENVLVHQEAQRLSITDGLTGVWNQRYFRIRLRQEVERAIRFRRSLSLLVLDIDYFKSVNDGHGHQRGDSILIELAGRLASAVRGQVDTVARYGGEEFVLILPETPLEGAAVVAEKIRESIAAVPFGSEGEEPVTVTASIGAACFPQNGSSDEALIRAADQAMYEAKLRGRNRVITADELDRGAPTDTNAFPPMADEPREP
jgi:diguanylate cyclase (GGDEF)-like protein